jgi:hypothetical protein
VFEKKVLRRLFGPTRKWWEAGEDCIMRSFLTCTLQRKEEGMGGTCSTCGRNETCIHFGRNLKG